MSNLLTEQQTLLVRMSRFYTNFKKNGSSKMTLSNCKNRMENLEKIWIKSEYNHSKLLNDNSDAVSKSDYIKQDEFAIAEEIYLDKSFEFQPFWIVVETLIQPVIGEFYERKSFKDLFTTLVINKSNISNVTKLHHLKPSLEGDAARLISNLESLKRSVSKWDDVLVYHIVALLDTETRKQWEKQLGVGGFRDTKITSFAPNIQITTRNSIFLESLDLADPQFAYNGMIELLLGASIHAKIMEGQINSGDAN
ncbi:hypothetical protein WA026_018721 [Henosepilachna vigintioctopunctata]|uniref:Uncharacterized protein n=1 Tax=Henosepilachna vigintioctopunctata TaxID=420089 RepID=A0AAW1TW47_9CUCU